MEEHSGVAGSLHGFCRRRMGRRSAAILAKQKAFNRLNVKYLMTSRRLQMIIPQKPGCSHSCCHSPWQATASGAKERKAQVEVSDTRKQKKHLSAVLISLGEVAPSHQAFSLVTRRRASKIGCHRWSQHQPEMHSLHGFRGCTEGMRTPVAESAASIILPAT